MAAYATPFLSNAALSGGRSYSPPRAVSPGNNAFKPNDILSPYVPQTLSQFKLPSGVVGAGVSADYPVFSVAHGRYESGTTGEPWNGPLSFASNVNPAPMVAKNGVPVTGQPNQTPASDAPSVVKIVKQPEIAAATGDLLKQQQAQSAQVSKDFNAYLQEARDANAASKVQLGKDQAALDTTGIDNELRANNASYKTAQDSTTADISKRNQDFAKQTQDTIDRLTKSNQDYETAAQAVAGQAVNAAQKRNDLYQLTSGTPTSGSGNLTNRAIRAYIDVNTPLQRELADRRFSQIANIERPYQTQLYGNDQNLFARESGLSSDYASRTENTARYLQDLKMKTAGMSRQMASEYLRNLGLPFEIAQRIISGDISNLSGIAALDARANEYTFTQPFDPNRLPTVQQYSPSYPSPVSMPRSYVPNYAPTAAVPGYTPADTASLDPAGTWRGDVQRGLPDWILKQRYPLNPAFGGTPNSATPNFTNWDPAGELS